MTTYILAFIALASLVIYQVRANRQPENVKRCIQDYELLFKEVQRTSYWQDCLILQANVWSWYHIYKPLVPNKVLEKRLGAILKEINLRQPKATKRMAV